MYLLWFRMLHPLHCSIAMHSSGDAQRVEICDVIFWVTMLSGCITSLSHLQWLARLASNFTAIGHLNTIHAHCWLVFCPVIYFKPFVMFSSNHKSASLWFNKLEILICLSMLRTCVLMYSTTNSASQSLTVLLRPPMKSPSASCVICFEKVFWLPCYTSVYGWKDISSEIATPHKLTRCVSDYWGTATIATAEPI